MTIGGAESRLNRKVLMALGTVTKLKRGVIQGTGLRIAVIEVQPTTGANYTADGEAMNLRSHFGFRSKILYASCEPKDEASAAREFLVDPGAANAAPKLVVMDAATALEVAAASNQSTFRTRILAVGV